jgi:hypothetical protein
MDNRSEPRSDDVGTDDLSGPNNDIRTVSRTLKITYEGAQ